MPSHAHAQELVPPKLLSASQPELPDSIKLSEPRLVVIEITIDEQGAVRDPSVLTSSGDAALDDVALAAIAALRFEPALRDGVAIAARIPFRFDFAASPEPPPPAPLPPPLPPPGPAPAADAKPADPAPIVLSVRGERPPREVTSYSVSRQEIRTIPGTGGDPLRAIESMPGVGRAPFGAGDLIIRGSSPNDSAVFINGITVPNNPYHFGGLTSVIPNEALEKLDFRPGNFGPEYGRAMGGVVDIGLRAPRKDRFSGVAQFDVIDGRLLLEGPLGKRTRAMIAGRRSWLDAWYGAVMPAQVGVKAAPVYWDAQFVLEHDLTRRTTVQLFAFGSDDKLALLIKAPDAQDPGNGGQLGAHVGFIRAGLRTQTVFNDAVSWNNTFAYGPDRQDLRFGTDTFDIMVHNFALRSELRARFHERITGTLGLDMSALRYDLDLYVKPYPTTDETQGPYFARPSRRFVDEIWMFRPAAYVMAEITPWRGTRLMPSLRVDYARDTGDVTFDPRFVFRSLLHDGPHSTTLKGGVGLYQQPPLPQESVKPFGTPGVQSNRSIHSSLGVEQGIVEGLTLSVELFYKHYDKLVIAYADEDQSAIGARFENTGSGRAYGSELLLKYQGNKHFVGWVAYTLSRSERRNSDSEPYSLFQYDQTHILSVLGTVKLGRGMTLGGRFRYITGLPLTPIDGGVLDLDAGAYTPVPGASYSTRVPAFHQLDLRFDKTWQFTKGNLMLYLELRNMYNHQNVEGRGYRYDYAQSQKQTGLPLMPVIGFRGEL